MIKIRSFLQKVYKNLKLYLKPKYAIDLPAIKTYREFDSYKLDIESYPAKSFYVSSILPSEPPSGINYFFGPSGFIGKPNSNYCVIHTPWRDINNYCHWNFSELPLLFLGFESAAKNIVIPDSIFNAKHHFQKRWLKILKNIYPDKKLGKYSNTVLPSNILIPINHDTSSNLTPIGNCFYKDYHHGRATPYLIDRIENFYKDKFKPSKKHLKSPQKIYIERKNRRLKNEKEVQAVLLKMGFTILRLENINLDDQIIIFSNARIIIGFHGAGLSNLLFCDPSVQVLEIVDPDCVYPSYIDGLIIPGKKATRTYFHLLCVMKKISYRAIESSNYHLNIKEFKKKLEKPDT
jgi:hypothetical protein